MWHQIEPLLANAVIAILTAGVPFLVAWLRSRTQRMVVEQATTEAEAKGHRVPLSGPAKKQLAMSIAGERLGGWTTLSDERLSILVEDVLPQARMSARPPPRDEEP